MASSGLTIDTSYITPSGVLAATIVPTVLSIISVILRFHVRRKQKAPILWDDWLLVPGLVCMELSTEPLETDRGAKF